MWFGIRITRKKRNIGKIWHFSYMGAELEKGRNLWAETSGGQIRKGPKPLATVTMVSARHQVRGLPEVSALFGFDPQRFPPRGFGPFRVRPPYMKMSVFANISFFLCISCYPCFQIASDPSLGVYIQWWISFGSIELNHVQEMLYINTVGHAISNEHIIIQNL